MANAAPWAGPEGPDTRPLPVPRPMPRTGGGARGGLADQDSPPRPGPGFRSRLPDAARLPVLSEQRLPRPVRARAPAFPAGARGADAGVAHALQPGPRPAGQAPPEGTGGPTHGSPDSRFGPPVTGPAPETPFRRRTHRRRGGETHPT
jgi:hypothetical protein